MVSVIVPVYNSEKYLKRCINSILNQTYFDIEVILVDDGSTDSSQSVCKRLAKKDTRIKYYRKENEGAAIARNYGIEKATGKYITFVDSDDWIDPHLVSALYNKIQIQGSDFVLCNYVNVDIRGKKRQPNRLNLSHSFDFSNLEDVLLFFSSRLPWRGPCFKIYKTSIIKNENIRFPQNITVGEDTIFNLRYLLKCHYIDFLNVDLYFYNKLNELSISKKYDSNFVKNCLTFIGLKIELLSRYKLKKTTDQYYYPFLEEILILIKTMASSSVNMHDFGSGLEETKNYCLKNIDNLSYKTSRLFSDRDNEYLDLFFAGKYNELYKKSINQNCYSCNKFKSFFKKIYMCLLRFYYFGIQLG